MDATLTATYKTMGWVLLGIVAILILYGSSPKIGGLVLIAVILAMIFAGMRRGTL